MKKKKPNYKLRRLIARIIIILFFMVILLFAFRKQIIKIPLLIQNSNYKDIINTFFNNDYDYDEVKDIVNKLKKKKKISKIDKNMITALHDKGYKKETINFVLLNMSKTQIRKLLNKDFDLDLEKYLAINIFNFDNYYRYMEYKENHPDLSFEDVITRVELDLDKYDYEEPEKISNPDSYTTLVNKHRYLDKNYVPSDLVEMEDKYSNNSHGVNLLRKEVYEEFKKMVDDAEFDGIKFYAETTYRSYEKQDDIYYEYLYINGSEMADKYAAKAGYSEHQLGLAIDLANIWNIEEGDKEYRWIEKYGYKYGFILRYKKKDETITRYAAEDYHIRYVGKKAAETIHKKNITLDEYYVKYIKNKDSK